MLLSTAVRWLALAVFTSSLNSVGMADPPHAIEESKATLLSHRKKIAIERFAPKEPGRYPAVVVLHGVGGIGAGADSPLRERARDLARHGYVALIPHFFDRTGTKFNNPYRNRDFFQMWVETIGDTVTYAGRSPNVDRGRIGLLGYSLGAYLALSEAMFDRRVSAVVESSGALLDELAEHLEVMPPTLILHGDADRSVPVREAHKLATLFDARQIPYELSIYKGAGHAINGEAGEDAWGRTLEFLDRHVKR